jgi:hypothetical protein
MLMKSFRSFYIKYAFLLILSVVPLASAQDTKLPPDVPRRSRPHIFSGVGHVQKEGDHFRWIPVPYINDSQKAR